MPTTRPLPGCLPEPPPVLDEAMRRKLEAQLPKPGGEALRGYNALARDVPRALGLVVIGIVLGGLLLQRHVPELAANVGYLVWSLWLAWTIRRKTRQIRALGGRGQERDRLEGQRWLLVGALVLVLPQPHEPPGAALAWLFKWPLAALAFGIGWERLVLAPRRAARAKAAKAGRGTEDETSAGA